MKTASMISAVTFVLIVSVGCVTVNVPIGTSTTSQAVIWDIDYEQPDSWGYSTDKVIRIDNFTSINFLNGTGIVIQLLDGTLNVAETDVWDTFPGKALSEFLSRDMMADGYYSGVFRTATVLSEDIRVDGFIRQFGGKVNENSWEAVLDVDVTVIDVVSNSIILQKNYSTQYSLESPSYADLSEGMGILIQIFSEELRGDIYSAMQPIR